MSNDNKTHPLDKEFDINSNDFLYDEPSEIEIPDDPTLDTIIDFSLKAYKEQMDDLIHIEPKNKIKYLEIAEKFLGQAKDAIYKKEYIDVQRKKAIGRKQQDQQPVTPTDSKPVEEEQTKGKTRDELMDSLRVVK